MSIRYQSLDGCSVPDPDRIGNVLEAGSQINFASSAAVSSPARDWIAAPYTGSNARIGGRLPVNFSTSTVVS